MGFPEGFLMVFEGLEIRFQILLLRRNYGNLADARRDLQFLYSMR